MIEIKGLHSGYRRRQVLHGIDLSVEDGSVLTILGPNGCGKSTLLKSMLGFVPLSAGEVLLNGLSVACASPRQISQTAAYLPQQRSTGDLLVGQLVLHGRFPYLHYPRTYQSKDREIARQAMEEMGIADLADTPLRELSGGMRQKAHIAMALAQQTPIIVMDEPTTFLDVGQQVKFGQMVQKLAQGGKTVVLVLHDVLAALSISDKLAVISDGRLLEYGTPAQILSSRVLEQLYDVKISPVETASGTCYYYQAQEDIK